MVIMLAVALSLAMIVSLYLLLSPSNRGPSYQGKTAEEWLAEIPSTNQMQAIAAFQAMGSNALPVILRAIKKQDSAFDRFYQRTYLRLPSFFQDHLPRSLPDALRWKAAGTAVANVSYSKAALPEFCGLLGNCNHLQRICLFFPLVRLLGPGDVNCVPSLVGCLRSTNVTVQFEAAVCLEKIGPGAEAAVPVLTNLLNSPDPEMRKLAMHALIYVDSEIAARY